MDAKDMRESALETMRETERSLDATRRTEAEQAERDRWHGAEFGPLEFGCEHYRWRITYQGFDAWGDSPDEAVERLMLSIRRIERGRIIDEIWGNR